MSYTILSAKENALPPGSYLLVDIAPVDGSTVCHLATYALTYGGNTYLDRLENQAIDAIQMMSSAGYDTAPSLTLQIHDEDGYIKSNFVDPHGWRGAIMTVTFVMWDATAAATGFSTDSYVWTFITGKPSRNAKGIISVQGTQKNSFSRLKQPGEVIQNRCWNSPFPATFNQRTTGATVQLSDYYGCGYSPDCQTSGTDTVFGIYPVGNLQASTTVSDSGGINATVTTLTPGSITGTLPSVPFQATVGSEEMLVTATGTTWTITRAQNGTTAATHAHNAAVSVPFVTCDYTSTSCKARGMYSTDSQGRHTCRFTGSTWQSPIYSSGRQYTTGQKVTSYNDPNQAVYGKPVPIVLGTQWVDGLVIAPAGDPNSDRAEVIVCLAFYGPISTPVFQNFSGQIIQAVLVNGVQVQLNNSDRLFTYYLLGNGGGRSGYINTDAIFDSQGDPHGSQAKIEFVVPKDLAAPGSVPQVRVRCVGPAIAIPFSTSAPYDPVALFTTNPAWHMLFLLANSNYTWNDLDIASFMNVAVHCGMDGFCDISGSTLTINGTNGSDYFLPNMAGQTIYIGGTGYPIASVSSGTVATVTGTPGNATNVAWYVNHVTYTALDGSTQHHARFRSSLAIETQQLASTLINGFKSCAGLMLSPNTSTGKMALTFTGTLAEQQPSAVSGSNYTTAISSVLANGTSANGYAAYKFDQTNIIEDSFEIDQVSMQELPNFVQIQFQDEDNQYQVDTILQYDLAAYAASGNQDIALNEEILGICNFDQGTRRANTMLAERLRGNARGDSEGTDIVVFRTTSRCIHLAAVIGQIILIDYPNPAYSMQLFRVLSARPVAVDATEWEIRARWHSDTWYRDDYVPPSGAAAQVNYPGTFNTSLVPGRAIPWAPGYEQLNTNDALDAGDTTFRLQVKQQSNADGSTTQLLTLLGYLPINNLSPAVGSPLVPQQASAASTGGFLASGDYVIVLCAVDSNGLASGPSKLIYGTIPSGVTAGTLTVSNIYWPSGTSGWAAFIGPHVLQMRAGLTAGSGATGTGTPSSLTITGSVSGNGVPDVETSKMLVRAKRCIVSGVDEEAVVSYSGSVLTFSSVLNWTTNQWAGRVVSIIGKSSTASYLYDDGVIQWPQSYNIVSNTGNTLTLDRSVSAHVEVNDWAVIRNATTSATSSIITDSGQSFTVGGLVGNQVLIINGTGAGQPAQTITGNTSTAITIGKNWVITPDSTSVWIVVEPTYPYQFETNAIQNGGFNMPQKIAAIPVDNYSTQNLLIDVVTEDSSSVMSVQKFAPFREVHIYGTRGNYSAGNVRISKAGTIL